MRIVRRFLAQATRIFVLGAAALSAGRGLAAAGEPIKAAELAERIKAGTAPVILDVRSADEFAEGHIPGAINVPFNQVAKELPNLKLSHEQEVVVHCEHGGRAAKAETTLREAGFTNVRDLTGHLDDWRAAGLPLE